MYSENIYQVKILSRFIKLIKVLKNWIGLTILLITGSKMVLHKPVGATEILTGHATMISYTAGSH